mmetsp:Transcript_25016/g.52561  ORF Transcript_25016/g.52561 Transcript_25016/m.52561 type:complete len:848 (-) Transcript_25016:2057-4600(-)
MLRIGTQQLHHQQHRRQRFYFRTLAISSHTAYNTRKNFSSMPNNITTLCKRFVLAASCPWIFGSGTGNIGFRGTTITTTAAFVQSPLFGRHRSMLQNSGSSGGRKNDALHRGASFGGSINRLEENCSLCNLIRMQFTSSDIENYLETSPDGVDGVTNNSKYKADDDDVSNSFELFDDHQYAAFREAIEIIASKRNVIRDFKKSPEDLQIVLENLLDRRRKLPRWDVYEYLPPSTEQLHQTRNETLNGNEQNKSLRTGNKVIEKSKKENKMSYTERKLRERRDMYLEATNLTAPQHRLATVLLAHLSDHCAKTSNPLPLYVGWEKVLEAGMMPMERTLSTSLYVLSLDEGKESDRSDKGDRDVVSEVAMFHDALYEPTEKTIALLVKSLVGRGDAAGAEALLESIADGPLADLRHRTTSPILKLYCEKGEIDAALRLYHKMKHTSRVVMEAGTYSDFIAAVAENGYFRSDSEHIDGAKDLGYNPASGPRLLDILISDMAEDVLDIPEESARVLRNGFALGFKESGLSTVSHTENLTYTSTLVDDAILVADRVVVDHDTAICPATNLTLRLIVLEEEQRVHVHDTLLVMASEKSKVYTAKLASRGRTTHDNAVQAEQATQILTEFSQWLDTREGKPYTAIVDGANVAYFGWGKINVYQLSLMVTALEKHGEHPLVIMPQKYTRKKFYLRQGVTQFLSETERALFDRLKEKGQLYIVEPMCHDDMYWMLASVSNQTVSTNGESMHVSKNNDEGRFPGLRPMVISNDKMRDHKLDLLEERSFRRWCCSHVVNYHFTEYIEDQREERNITFHAADIFSDEIQGNECSGGVIAWHFPVREWDANERFCLRLPQ